MSGVKLKAVNATSGLLTQLKCSDAGELNVNVSTSTLSVNVDGLEGLVGTTNGKLDTINTTLTAGGVVDISTLSTHAKQDTINTTLGTLSTHAKQDTINTTLGTLATHAKQDTINTTLGDLATEATLQIISEEFTKCDTDAVTITTSALPSGASTSAKQDTINTTLGTLATSAIQIDGTQQAKCMGIGDDGANKQMKTDNSGNVSAFLVSDVVMKPSNITNGDHASFSGSSVASMVRGRTNINDNTTGVFLHCDSAGALSVNSKSSVVKTTGEWLPTSTAIGDDNYSASLDCSSFREVRVFGKNASGIGPASVPIMGSQTDGGTYYKIGDISRDSVEISGVSELHYSGKVEMPTNFIKLYNNSGSGLTCEFDYVGFSV